MSEEKIEKANPKKLVKVNVVTPKGVRHLEYIQVIPDNSRCDIPCLKQCPYGKDFCTTMRDPRDPDNPNKVWMDFCGGLGAEGDTDNPHCIGLELRPVEGTVERNLGDQDDIVKNLIQKNPYIKVSDLIDKACPGVCPMYTENHEKCTASNQMCILNDVLKSTTYDPNFTGDEDKDDDSGRGEDGK